jgi:hypothetical protein
MSSPYEERRTAVLEAMAIQIAVLTELANELQRDKHFHLAHDVRNIVTALDDDEQDPFDRVKVVLKPLEDISFRLQRMGYRELVTAIDGARKVLRDRAIRLLSDTQPIAVEDLPKDDGKK